MPPAPCSPQPRFWCLGARFLGKGSSPSPRASIPWTHWGTARGQDASPEHPLEPGEPAHPTPPRGAPLSVFQQAKSKPDTYSSVLWLYW